MKTRKAYYPGSFELHQQFINAHPQALQLGQPQEGHLPWTFITDIDPANEDDICFKREPFMSLYSETALEANSVVDFIEQAVAFANEKVWGTLVASIVVHPKSMKDPAAVNRQLQICTMVPL
jgi:aldehyde dehydrogenase (NAD(P)+)